MGRLLILLACSGLLAPQSDGQAGQPDYHLYVQCHELQQWLEQKEVGPAWNERLELDAVMRRLQARQQVLLHLVGRQLHLLSSCPEALQFRPFHELKAALQAYYECVEQLPAERLIQLVVAERNHYRPTLHAQLDQSKEWLRKSVARLHDLSGSSKTNWTERFQLEELDHALREGVLPGAALLVSVMQEAERPDPQLNQQEVSDFSQALRSYAFALQGQLNEHASLDFLRTVEELSGGIAYYEQHRDLSVLQEVGAILSRLENRGQVPHLTKALRQRYWHPNVRVRLDQTLFSASCNSPINDRGPVAQWVLDSWVTGTRLTQGQFTVHLDPHPEAISLKFLVNGQITADTICHNGRATARCRSVTRLEGEKNLLIDTEGWRSLPTSTEAVTDARVRSIAIDGGPLIRRIGQRIAWRKAAERRPIVNQIVASQAEQTALERMERRVDEEFGPPEVDSLLNTLHTMLLRRGQYPRSIHLCTEEDAAYVEVLHAPGGLLGAAKAPPAWTEDPADLEIQIHESAVENMASSLLAGWRLTELGFAGVANWLRYRGSESAAEPWRMDFRMEQPVSLNFTENGFRATLHLESLGLGERNSRLARDVVVEYEVGCNAEGALFFQRQGPIRWGSPEDSSLDEPWVEVALGEILRPQYTLESFCLPNRLSRAGDLQWKQLEFRDGWLLMSCQRAQAAQSTLATKGTAASPVQR